MRRAMASTAIRYLLLTLRVCIDRYFDLVAEHTVRRRMLPPQNISRHVSLLLHCLPDAWRRGDNADWLLLGRTWSSERG